MSVEVLMDEDGHHREAGADDEVIARSMLLWQITGGQVAVVTADTGMRLRAQAAGLQVVRQRVCDGLNPLPSRVVAALGRPVGRVRMAD
ncbi:hypothetical protein GXW83_24100 [Streptacidiphilus sp. PB12-B1b]|uniref:hypothetical protein n=1 Tax=Streptacidiphilus sp. PB12-B1b TaxID=2705012 RepID=UPI0015FCBE20|nr:hypothetical protein [Streptacidiphilus sp. PB12-B1b]QMU78329.1 hypothetical protein GXW83_24100 [Streptacidiphilus sp. PB12-B1b]